MKLAITAQGKTMESEVDPRLGRAQYLLRVDTETGTVTVHDNNTNLNAVQGAGVQTAQRIAELGVEAVVTGNAGPKAFAVLKTAGIKVYPGATGTVSQAIVGFLEGRLSPAEEANVSGHWV